MFWIRYARFRNNTPSVSRESQFNSAEVALTSLILSITFLMNVFSTQTGRSYMTQVVLDVHRDLNVISSWQSDLLQLTALYSLHCLTTPPWPSEMVCFRLVSCNFFRLSSTGGSPDLQDEGEAPEQLALRTSYGLAKDFTAKIVPLNEMKEAWPSLLSFNSFPCSLLGTDHFGLWTLAKKSISFSVHFSTQVYRVTFSKLDLIQPSWKFSLYKALIN